MLDYSTGELESVMDLCVTLEALLDSHQSPPNQDIYTTSWPARLGRYYAAAQASSLSSTTTSDP